MSVSADETLVLPHWARLKFCNVRKRWLLLVPEQVFYPCPQTVEVLKRLSEPCRMSDIAEALSEDYDAPPELIAEDLLPIVTNLVEEGYVRRQSA